MRVTKLGHSCVLVEENGVNLLVDPGKWSEGLSSLPNIDAILVTHSHSDHCDPEAVAQILSANPGAKMITNSDVRGVLVAKGVPAGVFLEGNKFDIRGLEAEAFEVDHREIHPEDSKAKVPNTGFLVGGKFFHPGDALFNPGRPVEVFAMPVSGGCVRVGEAIDLALEMKPKICFPIHDGGVVPGRYGGMHMAPERVLPKHGIRFVVPEGPITF